MQKKCKCCKQIIDFVEHCDTKELWVCSNCRFTASEFKDENNGKRI